MDEFQMGKFSSDALYGSDFSPILLKKKKKNESNKRGNVEQKSRIESKSESKLQA